ncbi:MAG: ATP-binding cassette domain-containing protein [Alphaproteobacteria bacterium]|nr:ATP-binding cassette domain-containing protein [Alphaproteobacteria bacterium]
MSPLQNILVPASFDALSAPAALRSRAHALLERVGVPPVKRGIETLSRGERQRVAIARALLMAPRLLVADEPTASLDAAAGAMVIELLLEIRRDHPCTFLTVTHDMALNARCDRQFRLEAGRIQQPVAA